MKSSVVKKNDYELYTIPIKFRNLGRNCRPFIARELEKKHPCFSDRCTFDSRIHFGKKGLFAKVAVMDSLKLAQYKKNTHGTVRLEGLKHTEFFTDVGKKILYAAGIAVFCLAGAVFFVTHSKGANKTGSARSDGLELTAAGDALQAAPQIDSVFSQLLEGISNAGGSVSRFVFTRNLYGQDNSSFVLNVTVSNCYPEDLFLEESVLQASSIELSPVSYSAGIPQFTYGLTCYGNFNDGEAETAFTAQDFKDLRLCVMESGGKIFNEDFAAKEISFTADGENFVQVFSALGKCLDEMKIVPAVMNLEFAEENVSCTLNFLSGTWGRSAMEQLVRNKNAFFRNAKLNAGNRNHAAKKSLEQKSASSFDVVGKIVTKDGKEIVYYRCSDGSVKSFMR